MKLLVISLVVFWCSLRIYALPDDILVAGLFNDGEQALAFQYAVDAVNADTRLLPHSTLHAHVVNLTIDDSYHAAKKVCSVLHDGVAAIVGPQSENTANHVQSICDAMNVPHIDIRWNVNDERTNSFSINLHPYPPSLSRAYRDVLEKLHWKQFVVLYEDNESLKRIHSLLKNATWNFALRKLDESGEYRPMLKEIKLSKTNNVVIDVSKDKIYEIFRQGAMVGIMTSYYRYFVTNLDLYLVDLMPFNETGANITGIQLVDPKKENVKQLVENLKRYVRPYQWDVAPRFPFDYMVSTDAALVYDSVELLATALTDLEYTQQVDISKLYCEGDKAWQHGESIVNYMKMYSRPSSPLNPASPHRPPSPQPVPPYPYDPWMLDMAQGRRGRGGRVVGGPGGIMGSYYQPPLTYNMSSYASQYNQMRLSGITGMLKFNEDGFREDFELDILEMENGELKKVGMWSQQSGANFTRTWAETVQVVEQHLRNKTLTVCVAVTKPYVIEKEVDDGTGEKYEGFCIDLVKEIAKLEGFKVKFIASPDGKYGNIDKATGEWNGIVKQLLLENADLGIVDFTMTAERAEAVEFSMPFMDLGISIIFTKPIKQPPYLFSFMKPFSVEVWIYMATAYLGVSVLLFILARMAPDEWDCPYPCIEDPEELENSFTLLNSMWFIIGTFLCQGADIAPKAVSTRIVASIWWFFTLIMISSYTANLAAFLTVSRMDSPIKSAEDLAKQTKIKYGCKNGGSTYGFFRESNISTYKKMWQAMSTTVPSVFTDSNDDGVARVQKSGGQYAFLMESVSIEYEVERKCDLIQIGGLLDAKSYGIALPPGSPYTGIISDAILKLKEKGRVQSLKDDWWKGSDSCPKEEKKDAASAAELGLENVGGVFVVMVGGIALACVTACCEFMWKARKIATDDGVSFTKELCKELLFVIQFSKNTKPVRKTSLPARTDDSSIYGSSNYGYSEKN